MDVSRETFKQSDGDTRELILFDSILKVTQIVEGFSTNCAATHKEVDEKIRKSSRVNKAVSGGGGLIGGILSVLGLKIFS